MNSKFALSFGISLIIVGFLHIFFDTNNTIIFGLSISTSIFSFLNFFGSKRMKKNKELLYIIPFIILLSICCYSDSIMKNSILANIINSKITDILTFISFGFLFISEYYTYRIDILNNKILNIARIKQELEYTNIIQMLINKYLNHIVEKEIKIDTESEAFLTEIQELCEEKSKLCSMNYELLEMEKDNYSLDDFNDIYLKRQKIINYKEQERLYKERNQNKIKKN